MLLDKTIDCTAEQIARLPLSASVAPRGHRATSPHDRPSLWCPILCSPGIYFGRQPRKPGAVGKQLRLKLRGASRWRRKRRLAVVTSFDLQWQDDPSLVIGRAPLIRATRICDRLVWVIAVRRQRRSPSEARTALTERLG